MRHTNTHFADSRRVEHFGLDYECMGYISSSVATLIHQHRVVNAKYSRARTRVCHFTSLLTPNLFNGIHSENHFVNKSF